VGALGRMVVPYWAGVGGPHVSNPLVVRSVLGPSVFQSVLAPVSREGPPVLSRSVVGGPRYGVVFSW